VLGGVGDRPPDRLAAASARPIPASPISTVATATSCNAWMASGRIQGANPVPARITAARPVVPPGTPDARPPPRSRGFPRRRHRHHNRRRPFRHRPPPTPSSPELTPPPRAGTQYGLLRSGLSTRLTWPAAIGPPPSWGSHFPGAVRSPATRSSRGTSRRTRTRRRERRPRASTVRSATRRGQKSQSAAVAHTRWTSRSKASRPAAVLKTSCRPCAFRFTSARPIVRLGQRSRGWNKVRRRVPPPIRTGSAAYRRVQLEGGGPRITPDDGGFRCTYRLAELWRF
jgi:hypothetical protein